MFEMKEMIAEPIPWNLWRERGGSRLTLNRWNAVWCTKCAIHNTRYEWQS